jgi:hypothetical protein
MLGIAKVATTSVLQDWPEAHMPNDEGLACKEEGGLFVSLDNAVDARKERCVATMKDSVAQRSLIFWYHPSHDDGRVRNVNSEMQGQRV